MSRSSCGQVSKGYGEGAAEVQALRGVDLAVDEGELVAVMGPSGSGKSTLLTIAGSLEEPTPGEVLIGGALGRAMSRNDQARLRRRTIGYVFQDFNLLAGLTAAENVSLPLELDGVPAKKARAAALAALDRLGLAERAARFPDELSGGERQRVAIARAVVGERRLLLADEPSGALDSVNAEAVMRLMRDACRTASRRRRRHPRRPAGLLGRPGRVPAGRPDRRPDRPAARTRVTAHPWAPPVSVACRERPAGPPPTQRRRSRQARSHPLGVAAAAPREWRQQLGILTLITVAVAATVVGATVATTTPAPPSATFGSAREHATFTGSRAHVHAQIAALERRFGRVDVIDNETLPVLGSVQTYDLRAQNPRGPFGQPMLALVSGHFPAGCDQVALTSGLAAQLRLTTGGTWHAAGQSRRVVGVVSNPQDLVDEFALVAPGQVSSPTQVTVLFDAPRPIANQNVRSRQLASSANVINPATISIAAATLGMLLIALVATGGFAVLAQRRLRWIGMLGAQGATDRRVGLVVRANGITTGVAGALAGAVLGLVAWLAYRPAAEASAHHVIGAFDLPWLVVGLAVGLAIVASYAAAAHRPGLLPVCRSSPRSRAGHRSRGQPVAGHCRPGLPAW